MFDINSITLEDYTRLHARSDLTVEQERLLIKASSIHGKRWADEEAAARWLKANPGKGLSKNEKKTLNLTRKYASEQKSWKRYREDFDDDYLL
tara:strand:+ start:2640 stop:2918 length:279 start_codon:yes stop_codon:yes gene_type:complete